MTHRRSRRAKALISISTLAALGATGSAHAEITGPGIQPGHNITTFHNIDFVAVFGYPVGDQVTVDLVRAGHRIASATGEAVQTDDGGALEVNHGPVGPPQPGDCWENYTPDVRPGDKIQVRHGGGTEEVTIDEITIDQGPTLLADGKTIELRGLARTAGGTTIDATGLDSGEVRNVTTRVRATPTDVVTDPLRPGGWIASYRQPYKVFVGEGAGDQDFFKDSILTGDHAMGFGHVVPLPLQSMLVDGTDDISGPALGCEGSPAAANAVGTSSVKTVNIAALAAAPGADDVVLTLGGSAAPDVTSVAATLSDGTTTITPKAITMGANPISGHKGWSATFARSEITKLADGTLTAAAVFLAAGGPAPGKSMKLEKDLVAPTVASDPAPGTYEGPRGVSLASSETLLTYRTDGGAAGPGDAQYTGVPIRLEPGSRTITAYSEDAAGNAVRRSFAFTITEPPPVDPGAGTGAGTTNPPTGPGAGAGAGAPTGTGTGTGAGPAPGTGADPVSPPAGIPPLTDPGLGTLELMKLTRLDVPRQLRRARVRAKGLTLSVGVPPGAGLLRIEILRRTPDGRLVPVTRYVRAVKRAGTTRIVLRAAALRRKLTPGRYVVRVTPRRNASSLGLPTSATVRVTR